MRLYLKILFLASALPLFSQNVKYGGEFMATGVGARALAMGGAFTAVSGDITSVYWNPAGIGSINGLQGHLMHSERFAGLVNWDFITFGGAVRDDLSMAVSYYRLGVDGIPLTRLQNPDLPLGEIYIDATGQKVINDPYVYKRIDNIDNVLALTFAKKYSDFTIGVNAKIIRKIGGSASAWGIGFDVGAYWEPIRSFRTGLIIRDVTSTLIAWEGKERELIPPSLSIGASYLFAFNKITILPVLDFRFNFENRRLESQVSLGKAGIEVMGGCEINYAQKLSFRLGIDQSALTVGAGFNFSIMSVDYGFSPHNELGNTHRISLTAHILPNSP